MSSPIRDVDDEDLDTAPPANKGLLAVAGVLLLAPIVALMWVTSYNKEEPRLAGFPFFIWYQFLWVFLCSAFTWTAYLLVLRARPHRPIGSSGPAIGDAGDRDAFDGDPGVDEGGAR